MSRDLIMARSLAPEDILPGTYVMVLTEQRELLHPANPAEGDVSPKVTRVDLRPTEPQMPRLVLEVSLPFVVVKNHERRTEVLDTRSLRLARVSKRFARAAVSGPASERCDEAQAPACDLCGRS